MDILRVIQEILEVDDDLANQIHAFVFKSQIFDRNSKNEATHIYQVPVYALYKKDVWQEVWENVELKTHSEFKFNASIAESRVAKDRLKSGKVFFSSKTKTINLFDHKFNLNEINLPTNLKCIKSSKKESLQLINIPMVKKLWVRLEYSPEKGSFALVEKVEEIA